MIILRDEDNYIITKGILYVTIDNSLKQFPPEYIEKILPLNTKEIAYCKKYNIIIEDSYLTKHLKINLQVRKIQKIWKKYWYEHKDSNGENRYISYLKKKNNTLIL